MSSIVGAFRRATSRPGARATRASVRPAVPRTAKGLRAYSLRGIADGEAFYEEQFADQLGFSITKAAKKVGKATKKAAKKTVKTVKKGAKTTARAATKTVKTAAKTVVKAPTLAAKTVTGAAKLGGKAVTTTAKLGTKLAMSTVKAAVAIPVGLTTTALKTTTGVLKTAGSALNPGALARGAASVGKKLGKTAGGAASAGLKLTGKVLAAPGALAIGAGAGLVRGAARPLARGAVGAGKGILSSPFKAIASALKPGSSAKKKVAQGGGALAPMPYDEDAAPPTDYPTAPTEGGYDESFPPGTTEEGDPGFDERASAEVYDVEAGPTPGAGSAPVDTEVPEEEALLSTYAPSVETAAETYETAEDTDFRPASAGYSSGGYDAPDLERDVDPEAGFAPEDEDVVDLYSEEQDPELVEEGDPSMLSEDDYEEALVDETANGAYDFTGLGDARGAIKNFAKSVGKDAAGRALQLAQRKLGAVKARPKKGLSAGKIAVIGAAIAVPLVYMATSRR